MGGETFLDIVSYASVERCVFTPKNVDEVGHIFFEVVHVDNDFGSMVLLP